MRLVPTQKRHIELLKLWVGDESSAYHWGGPGLRYPFTEESFLEDIRWGEITSCSLLSDDGDLLGFGQYYESRGRCHLARLIVSPEHRGLGHGRLLIDELIRIGLRELGVAECSLFVISDNQQAIACYRSLGFKEAAWPNWMKRYEGIVYMVRCE